MGCPLLRLREAGPPARSALPQSKVPPRVPPRAKAEHSRDSFVVCRKAGQERSHEERCGMLGWALTFLIVALIAAVLGFGGIAGFAVEIAKIIFFVAIMLFLISAVIGLVRGRTPTVP